uniref:TPR repeat-containing protein n=1 Tax=uncultured marine thaumarchaeote AD1000_01_A07 TaxID=1455878 RepID=A0A075FGP8_9ARCH|nr:TPR repeat-containing protein [uncultured marine thaumarchaeote AD1000_01_A07]
MKQNMIKNYLKLFPIFLLLITVIFVDYAFAQDLDGPSIYNSQLDKLNQMFSNAHELFLKGEYRDAIIIYDDILEIDPDNYQILEMKGLALSNLRLESTLASQVQNAVVRDPSNLNKLSMLEFYKALEIKPNSTFALNGMGLGFGNFGEYSEAERYFEKSLKIDPNNKTTKNYLSAIENIKENIR